MIDDICKGVCIDCMLIDLFVITSTNLSKPKSCNYQYRRIYIYIYVTITIFL